jgi:hypothetical protein
MNRSLASLKKWLLTIIATQLTIFLIYEAKDFPCLTGAGLALADFEAFIFLVIIALPCFVWAVLQLVRRPNPLIWNIKWVLFFARVVMIGSTLYILDAIPVIFSFSHHPLSFVCHGY